MIGTIVNCTAIIIGSILVASNKENKKIAKIIEDNIASVEVKFKDKKAKEIDEIIDYRNSLLKLGINPNKFMCSIEAIMTRILKKKGFPSINPIVDLGNAVSIKNVVTLGAHDIGSLKDDICIRFSKKGDKFVAFGSKEEEELEDGELIYCVGNEVRTRRWIWRQSEKGKITEETTDVFFPIDGFKDKNYNSVINAMNELVELLQENFECQIKFGVVDVNNPEFEF